MKHHIARLTFGLMVGGLIVLVGCGSGGGAVPGDGAGMAGTMGGGGEGGSGESGQVGGGGAQDSGGTQAGSTGEAGHAGGSTGAAGAGGSSKTPGAGGSTGAAGSSGSTKTAGTGGSTGAAGAGGGAGAGGSSKTPGAGGSAGGAGGSRTTKPTGGSGSGGKTATASTGASGGDMASQCVEAINAVRAAVSKPSNYTGTWAPLANVVWSDTVAASAQAWASNLATTKNCQLEHESQDTYGENLAMGTNLTPKQAVDMWASEESLFAWSPAYSMADFNAGSGHYTQLVWRKSTQVGCGSATCSRSIVISCRFSPPGNTIGQAVY